MARQILYIFVGIALLALSFVLTNIPQGKPLPSSPPLMATTSVSLHVPAPTNRPPFSPTIPLPPVPLRYTFNVDGELQETDSIEHSESPYWWLDSGGRLIMRDGIGMTIQSALTADDPWYQEYRKTNPEDTGGGSYPQNIFRLVTKSIWNSVREEVYFKIVADNAAKSHNRNESNGVLLMSRYERAGNTLYYAGLRVDGTAIIKKKFRGTYYTMAQTQLFPGVYAENSNLLPHQEWLGIRMETKNLPSGSVEIRLFKRSENTDWVEIAYALDPGTFGATPPLRDSGHLGVRTDFMDVQFKDFYAGAI